MIKRMWDTVVIIILAGLVFPTWLVANGIWIVVRWIRSRATRVKPQVAVGIAGSLLLLVALVVVTFLYWGNEKQVAQLRINYDESHHQNQSLTLKNQSLEAEIAALYKERSVFQAVGLILAIEYARLKATGEEGNPFILDVPTVRKMLTSPSTVLQPSEPKVQVSISNIYMWGESPDLPTSTTIRFLEGNVWWYSLSTSTGGPPRQ